MQKLKQQEANKEIKYYTPSGSKQIKEYELDATKNELVAKKQLRNIYDEIQMFKDDVDINKIIENFKITGNTDKIKNITIDSTKEPINATENLSINEAVEIIEKQKQKLIKQELERKEQERIQKELERKEQEKIRKNIKDEIEKNKEKTNE